MDVEGLSLWSWTNLDRSPDADVYNYVTLGEFR